MTARFQPCEGYFIVDKDGRDSLLRAQAKEREDRFKKQQQFLMAQRLSELTKEEYGDDIIAHLEEQEVCDSTYATFT